MWATSGGKAVFGIAGGPGLGGSDPGLGNTTSPGVRDRPHAHDLPHLLLDASDWLRAPGSARLPNDYGTNYGLQFGIPNTNGPDILQSGFPDITVSSYTGFGVPNWMPLSAWKKATRIAIILPGPKALTRLRFGFDLVRHHLNHWQPEIGNFGPRGGLGFAGGETSARSRLAEPVQRVCRVPAGTFR